MIINLEKFASAGRKIDETRILLGMSAADIEKGIKKAKVEITRQGLPFRDLPDFNFNLPIDVPKGEEIKEYEIELVTKIWQQTQKGYLLHIRFVGESQPGSNNPMTYFLDPENPWSQLVFPKEIIIKENISLEDIIDLVNKYGLKLKKHGAVAKSISDVNEIKKGMRVDVFCQKASRRQLVCLKENDQYENIALGGGLKLQLNRVEEINKWEERVHFTAMLIFDDAAPRHLDLSTKEDAHFPRVIFPVVCTIDENGILTPKIDVDNFDDVFIDNPLIDSSSQVIDINKLAEFVIAEFFHFDREPLSQLFSALLLVDPKEETHSIDAVWSVPKDTKIEFGLGLKNEKWFQTRIIDIDGPDTLESWLSKLEKKELSLPKMLAQGLMAFHQGHTDFAKSAEIRHVAKIMNDRAAALQSVFNSDLLSSGIKNSIVDHVNESKYGIEFTRKITGSIALARMLKMLGVAWQNTDYDEKSGNGIRSFESKGNQLFLVSIHEVEMAFWVRPDKSLTTDEEIFLLVDKKLAMEENKVLREELGDILGKDILPVHYKHINEGE